MEENLNQFSNVHNNLSNTTAQQLSLLNSIILLRNVKIRGDDTGEGDGPISQLAQLLNVNESLFEKFVWIFTQNNPEKIA